MKLSQPFMLKKAHESRLKESEARLKKSEVRLNKSEDRCVAICRALSGEEKRRGRFMFAVMKGRKKKYDESPKIFAPGDDLPEVDAFGQSILTNEQFEKDFGEKLTKAAGNATTYVVQIHAGDLYEKQRVKIRDLETEKKIREDEKANLEARQEMIDCRVRIAEGRSNELLELSLFIYSTYFLQDRLEKDTKIGTHLNKVLQRVMGYKELVGWIKTEKQSIKESNNNQ